MGYVLGDVGECALANARTLATAKGEDPHFLAPLDVQTPFFYLAGVDRAPAPRHQKGLHSSSVSADGRRGVDLFDRSFEG